MRNRGKSSKQIAQWLGCSRQYVEQVIKRLNGTNGDARTKP
ncbi:MAG: helix-turn-helix domain-containing protein, partial [Sulfuricaulis sp.]